MQPQTPQPELFVFSANTQASLDQQVKQYKKYVLEHPNDISDIAYTRAVRRERLPHKSFAIVQPGKAIEASSAVKCAFKSPDRKVIMIFSGQGAQWAGMGRELLRDKHFLGDVADMDRILHGLKNPPSWSIQCKSESSLGREPGRIRLTSRSRQPNFRSSEKPATSTRLSWHNPCARRCRLQSSTSSGG